MPSRFAVRGHPLHPTLVGVPIGLFVWALIADVVFAWNGELVWYDIAFWTGWVAVIAGLVAALPGFGDWLTIARKSHPTISTAHMVLNVATVALFLVAGVLSLDRGATEGAMLGAVIALHAVGVFALGISGWLGGEMVYRHGLAVLPEAEHAIHEYERQEGEYDARHGMAPQPGDD